MRTHGRNVTTCRSFWRQEVHEPRTVPADQRDQLFRFVVDDEVAAALLDFFRRVPGEHDIELRDSVPGEPGPDLLLAHRLRITHDTNLVPGSEKGAHPAHGIRHGVDGEKFSRIEELALDLGVPPVRQNFRSASLDHVRKILSDHGLGEGSGGHDDSHVMLQHFTERFGSVREHAVEIYTYF